MIEAIVCNVATVSIVDLLSSYQFINDEYGIPLDGVAAHIRQHFGR